MALALHFAAFLFSDEETPSRHLVHRCCPHLQVIIIVIIIRQQQQRSSSSLSYHHHPLIALYALSLSSSPLSASPHRFLCPIVLFPPHQISHFTTIFSLLFKAYALLPLTPSPYPLSAPSHLKLIIASYRQ